MKKSRLYLLLIALFVIMASFIVLKYNTDKKKKVDSYYALLDRKGTAGQTDEWKIISKRGFDLLKAIRINPEDIKSTLALVSLYIQEARVTGNYLYYDKAAMKYVNDALKKDPANFEALTFKSVIYLSQHHFADGFATAEKAKNINPYNAFVYGILVDGSVEMGNYDSAIAYADKMVSVRPDIRSYARISYLREIYGDYPGAIEAMKLAVEAGLPGDETTEWSRVHLGKLYEYSGDTSMARVQYSIALNERPGYAYALAGLARIASAEKNYSKAITLYQQADSLVMDNSFKEELADIYYLTGENDKGDKIVKEVIQLLSEGASIANSDENIGHYADQELAYAYLKIKNYDKALYHALQEYNRRPDNIDVNETLAWVYYNKNGYEKALPYIKVSLKTGSKNPRLLCHAGLIYNMAGNKIMAKSLLEKALKNNPAISEMLKSDAEKVLNSL